MCMVDMCTPLAQDNVRALCSSPNVHTFSINHLRSLQADSDVCMLSVAAILNCMSHWPRIQKLSVFGFSPTPDSNDLLTPAGSTKSVLLQNGSLTLPQLRLLTTSSKSVLTTALFNIIEGLTNEDLRAWLVDVGPTLMDLSILCSPMKRQLDAEAYAMDIMLPIMTELYNCRRGSNWHSCVMVLRSVRASCGITGLQSDIP